MTVPKAIVIAGPTASGKSALALAVAAEFGGVVVNADSQQCYRDLPTLTARPTAADEARVPHRLFGTLGPLERDAAPNWARRAAVEIAGAGLAIIVGGSGLYLQALMAGMPKMPDVPEAVRDAARALRDAIGPEAFHQRLTVRDPATAARLAPGDTQRVLRAWEVMEASGRALSAWQADPPVAPIAASYHRILLIPPRPEINAACEGRFDRMMAAGAIEEVRALRAAGVPPSAPIMRVLGAGPLAAHLAGESDLATAIRLAKTATRQYAKRQQTWFRYQFFADRAIETKFSERLLPEIFSNIRRFLLT